MSVGTVNRPDPVEHVQVLDERGVLVGRPCESLDDTAQLSLYRSMVRARLFDELLLKLQRRGEIGTFAPVKGQEAQVGAVASLRDDDWFVPSFRETAAALHRGADPRQMLLYNAGYNEGAAAAAADRNLPIAIPVASQLLHAVGIGYAMRRREENAVVMVFFGDGATSEGDFHEALNFAAVFETPVVFFCQNNQWAISTPRDRQTRARTLAQKAISYGMPGTQVDGNDVLAVHRVAREAVERGRSGDGPTLIEALTYRLEVHTTADDPTKYRDEDEEQAAEAREPLVRMAAYLRARALLDDDAEHQMRDAISLELNNAWKAAQHDIESLGSTMDFREHLYASPESDGTEEDERDDEDRDD